MMDDDKARKPARGFLRSLEIVGLCAIIGGCAASPVNRGADFYTQKRYIDAAQAFEHCEPQLQQYDEAEQARYGLYRGATLLALGDVADAERWLSYGATVANRSLSPSERDELVRGLVSATPLAAGLSVLPANAKAAALIVALRQRPGQSPALAAPTLGAPAVASPTVAGSSVELRAGQLQ
jgi:hypothetical protein